MSKSYELVHTVFMAVIICMYTRVHDVIFKSCLVFCDFTLRHRNDQGGTENNLGVTLYCIFGSFRAGFIFAKLRTCEVS